LTDTEGGSRANQSGKTLAVGKRGLAVGEIEYKIFILREELVTVDGTK
jgi:hypothetical protein